RAKAGADLADGLAYGAADWASTVASMSRDALDVPSGPPLRGPDSDERAERARPQGGPEGTVQAVDEQPEQSPASEPEADGSLEAEPEAEGEPKSVYVDSDVGIDEMYKPEHEGEWELSP